MTSLNFIFVEMLSLTLNKNEQVKYHMNEKKMQF